MSKKAIVFAGQGAQFVGMGKDIAEAYPQCKELFDRADEALGFSLSKICFEGPEEDLTKSNYCQPAIFVTSIACYKALCVEQGDPAPSAAAGLSLGEWSALHMAGALTFEDTLRVLEARGRFMQEACEERDGSMVSVIGLTAEEVARIAGEASVEVANLNSSAQTVLSGERSGIMKAEELAKEAGAKRALVLKVAGAFHSSLMSSAAEKLEEVLAEVSIKEPIIPVMANVTGSAHGAPEDIKRNMLAQVTSSVRWLDCIETLKNTGVGQYIECGPGKVLSGLIKRIDSEAVLNNIQDIDSLQKVVNTD